MLKSITIFVIQTEGKNTPCICYQKHQRLAHIKLINSQLSLKYAIHVRNTMKSVSCNRLFEIASIYYALLSSSLIKSLRMIFPVVLNVSIIDVI